LFGRVTGNSYIWLRGVLSVLLETEPTLNSTYEPDAKKMIPIVKNSAATSSPMVRASHTGILRLETPRLPFA